MSLFKPNVKEKRDVAGLIKALVHKDMLIREEAAKALGAIGDQRAVEPLIYALNDEDNEVRAYAAKALGKIRDPKAIGSLIQCLRQGDSTEWGTLDVWEAAADSLGKIGDAAVKPLMHALKNWTDNNIYQYNAKEALKGIGKPAVESLIQALKHKDKHRYSRVLSAEALGEIGDQRAVEPLIYALKDETLRVYAGEALGEIGDKRALESLIQAFIDRESASPKDRGIGTHGSAVIAIALAKIGDKRPAGIIIDFIFDRLTSFNRDLDYLSTRLFEDYTELILKARFVEETEKAWLSGNETFYNFDKCNQAIERLCGINTKISTNILYKVASKKDDEGVTMRYTHEDHYYGTLSFKHQRKAAREELARRGNPPYDPPAYLDESAWKL